MFTVSDDKKIGQHLKELIDKNFFSRRQFCKRYLELANRSTDDKEIRNMTNRLSQILKGTKAIQTYDLPIFTEILGVTCEEILSAGTYYVPRVNRVTNYSIASSHDEKSWERYISREDKLILNSDEYGKTVVEYALDFGNYPFLKYLVDKKYIWFVGDKEPNAYTNFGAGTSIKRRALIDMNDAHGVDQFQYRLAQSDKFRMQMIALAIANDDFETLTKLKAREIPALYQTSFWGINVPDFNTYYNEDMVSRVAEANNKILDYFSDEFEITDRFENQYVFMFPFMEELIDLLVKNKNGYVTTVLQKAVRHNEQAYKKLKELFDEAVEAHIEWCNGGCLEKNGTRIFGDDYIAKLKADAKEIIKRDFSFEENGNIVLFRNSVARKGIVTNIICANKKSSDKKIQTLIDDLNASFEQIRNYQP
jgi:hypothetical protein